MINYQNALKLLNKYIKEISRREHCIGVSIIAEEIAEKINKKNPGLNIDIQKVKIAGLLHDIGRGLLGKHELNTIKILNKEGLGEFSKICLHGFLYEEELIYNGIKKVKFLPKTIENKIVVISDMYFNQNNQIVSLEERFDDIMNRFNYTGKELKIFLLAKERMKKLEKEIYLLV